MFICALPVCKIVKGRIDDWATRNARGLRRGVRFIEECD
jgi:hypothetical protein